MNQPKIKPRQGGPLFWLIAVLFMILALQVMAWSILAIGTRYWIACVLIGFIVFCQFPHAYTWLVRKSVQGGK